MRTSRSRFAGANDHQIVLRLRCFIGDLPNRIAGADDRLRRNIFLAKPLSLFFQGRTQIGLIRGFFSNPENGDLGLQRRSQHCAELGRAVGGRHSIAANQNLHRLQFVAGDQRVNDDGCADERQRHKCEPDFRAGKILRHNGTDLGADRRAGMHHQRNEDVDVAFDRVAECSITRRQTRPPKLSKAKSARQRPAGG